MTTLRIAPVTHRDKTTCHVAAPVPRPLFDSLEAECRKLGISKAEFIRRAIQEALTGD